MIQCEDSYEDHGSEAIHCEKEILGTWDEHRKVHFR